MSIIVGQAVGNSDFWDRTDELEDIRDAIDSGSHILISAPRRVGKTSIMYKILDTPNKIPFPSILIQNQLIAKRNSGKNFSMH